MNAISDLLDDIGIVKPKGTLNLSLRSDDDGVLVIPSGYAWCVECDALTPHNLIAPLPNGVIAKGDKIECLVCGSTGPIAVDYCENCGWPVSDEYPYSSTPVVAHLPGCHFDPDQYPPETEEHESLGFLYAKYSGLSLADDVFQAFARMNNNPYRTYGREGAEQERIARGLRLFQDQKCGCPEYEIVRDTWAFDYWSTVGYSSEWGTTQSFGFRFRCPVCGKVGEYEDGTP